MAGSGQLLSERYGLSTQMSEKINQTVQTILRHRSCRNYKRDEIPDNILRILLACAQSAPTKSNLQQYSILVLSDPELRSKVCRLVPSMGWLADAPTILVFLGDVQRIRQIMKRKGYKYKNNNADTFLNASVDAALAMQALITAAESLNLGTCPISYVRNRIEELSDLLKLPDGVFPICGLALGYRADSGVTAIRLPQDIVVHYNFYQDNDLEAKITEFDDRVHKINPIIPKNQRHTKKYGTLRKCTWSENVSRQLSVRERGGFCDYLKTKRIKLS